MSRIESFLKRYSNESTKRNYERALSEFFKSVYGKNDDHLEEHAEEYFGSSKNHLEEYENYFLEKHNYEDDVQNFLSLINDKTPTSVRLMISAIKKFLKENDVELPEKFWRRLMVVTEPIRPPRYQF